MALKDPGDGVGDREKNPLAAEDGVFSAYAAQLHYDGPHVDTRTQGQAHQPAYGLGLGRRRMAALTDGREDLKRLPVKLVDGEIHGAKPCRHLLGEAIHDLGTLAYGHTAAFRMPFCGTVLRNFLRCSSRIPGILSVHLLLLRPCGQNLHGTAAITVDGDALAAFPAGQPVNFTDVVLRGAVRQVDRLGNGVVRMTLESGLHTHMPERGDVHSGHEDPADFLGQGRQRLNVPL